MDFAISTSKRTRHSFAHPAGLLHFAFGITPTDFSAALVSAPVAVLQWPHEARPRSDAVG
jgi:hypothetical protein